jgi:hypothetical protein
MNLQELTKLNRDKIFELLKASRNEEAIDLLEKEFMAREAFHDLYVGWVNDLTAFLASRAGDQAVEDFYRWYYKKRGAEMKDDRKYRLPLDELVQDRAAKFSGGGHDFQFSIEEDNEKVTFVLNPCASGGRLIEKSDDPFFRTQEAHDWSHGRKGFPYYCAHCIFIWELKSIELIGYPRVVYHPPEKTGDPCIQHMYRDLTKIPEAYFHRLGKTKPGAEKS